MNYYRRTWYGDIEVRNTSGKDVLIIIRDTVSERSTSIEIGTLAVVDICSSHNYIVLCTAESQIYVVRLDNIEESYVASLDVLVLSTCKLTFSTHRMTQDALLAAKKDLGLNGSLKYVNTRSNASVPRFLLTSTNSNVFLIDNRAGVSSIKRLFSEVEMCDERTCRPTVIQCQKDILVTQADSGHSHSVFLTDDGKVYSLGTGSRGELGVGQLTNSAELILVNDLEELTVKSIASGGWHTVVQTDSDDVYVWGWNHMMQLGEDKQSTEYFPTPLELDDPIQSIEAYRNWTCIRTDKEVVTHGSEKIGKPDEGVKLHL